MLFDLLSAIELTISAAIIVATLSFTLARTAGGRLRAAGALGAWFITVVALGATGALSRIGPPGLGLTVVLPVVALCLAFFRLPAVRAAMLAIPLPALIAANIVRFLGDSFILLYVAGRLPAPFAPIAGWGDIFVGLTAGPVAWMAARRGEGARGLVLAWNLLGLLDLITAIGLGTASAPGPLQIFTAQPDSSIMMTLPWLLIPGFVVPALMACHIAIFYRLARSARRPEASGSAVGNPARA
jgi:hypothetical protein